MEKNEQPKDTEEKVTSSEAPAEAKKADTKSETKAKAKVAEDSKPQAKKSSGSSESSEGTSKSESTKGNSSSGSRNSSSSQGGRRRGRDRQVKEFDKDSWKPRTTIGKMVKSGEITDLKTILDAGHKILDAGIIDVLLPGYETDLLLIGQSKGKFGGGQRRVFKQVQKKTMEGNKPKFATIAVVGNKNGYVGIGHGKSKETVPAREKAIRNAKLNVMKIKRGCGSWDTDAREPNSIPFAVEGKCGSCIIRLMPAPRGIGLCVEKECAKILRLAGIEDVWSKTFGQTKTKLNLIKACVAALEKLSATKVQPRYIESLGIVDGPLTVKDEGASASEE